MIQMIPFFRRVARYLCVEDTNDNSVVHLNFRLHLDDVIVSALFAFDAATRSTSLSSCAATLNSRSDYFEFQMSYNMTSQMQISPMSSCGTQV